MLQHNPSLQSKAAELQIRKEKSMYEELFGKPFTENGGCCKTSSSIATPLALDYKQLQYIKCFWLDLHVYVEVLT